VSITGTLIIQMIVFLILVWFTMKFVWPPIANALDERAKKIADGLAAADKAKSELSAANKRVEDELAKSRNESASRWPMPSAVPRPSSRSQGPRHGRRQQDRCRCPCRSRAADRQGARSAARAGRRIGRQGRRADSAQGSQCRRPCRPAEPPQDRAVRGRHGRTRHHCPPLRRSPVQVGARPTWAAPPGWSRLRRLPATRNCSSLPATPR
jgi:hypothetical protein